MKNQDQEKKPKTEHKVHYYGMNSTLDAPTGTNLLQVSIKNKIPHLHECGGHGLCTTCRVKVVEGAHNLSKPNAQEHKIASERGWEPQIRLACQAEVMGDVAVQRLVWNSSGISNLQLEQIDANKGEERNLALVFCDMRNFTPLASRHPNFDLAYIINKFFEAMGEPIAMNNGVIYQYAGDEIIGLFGTSEEDPTKFCQDAMRAALGMQYAVERLNKLELRDFEQNIDIGIGLHYGKAFMGKIGHQSFKQWSVIGDPMNITSRIQAQNKTLDTNILVSEDFLQHLTLDSVILGIKSMVSLKGKESLFTVHEVLGFKQPDVNLEVQATLEELLIEEEKFAESFYQKVFERAPEVQELFTTNMLDQGRMLTHMLGAVVHALSRPDHLVMGLKALGEQHANYGVALEHFPLVQEVLLETIYEQLGEMATPRVKSSWEQAITQVIDLMKQANVYQT